MLHLVYILFLVDFPLEGGRQLSAVLVGHPIDESDSSGGDDCYLAYRLQLLIFVILRGSFGSLEGSGGRHFDFLSALSQY